VVRDDQEVDDYQKKQDGHGGENRRRSAVDHHDGFHARPPR
jgi:hypothetical protein